MEHRDFVAPSAQQEFPADERLRRIRQSEALSHTAMYGERRLYQPGSWLHRPVRPLLEALPLLEGRGFLRALDLGCGVGRNSLCVAERFRDKGCLIDCVDILPAAIRGLEQNAKERGLSLMIRPILSAIEDFSIARESYGLILAVSALEHVDTRERLIHKLEEIKSGLSPGGIVCLVVNTDIAESDPTTGAPLEAGFEVNFPSQELRALLARLFSGWPLLRSSLSAQSYDIPRGPLTSRLSTCVLSFCAQKPG